MFAPSMQTGTPDPPVVLLSLRAVYIPGHLNVGTDILLRQGLRLGECRLHLKW